MQFQDRMVNNNRATARHLEPTHRPLGATLKEVTRLRAVIRAPPSQVSSPQHTIQMAIQTKVKHTHLILCQHNRVRFFFLLPDLFSALLRQLIFAVPCELVIWCKVLFIHHQFLSTGAFCGIMAHQSGYIA